MWRNDEILKYYVTCAAVSALSWLSQFCTSKNRFRENSKFRHFVTYQITFLLTCQPHKRWKPANEKRKKTSYDAREKVLKKLDFFIFKNDFDFDLQSILMACICYFSAVSHRQKPISISSKLPAVVNSTVSRCMLPRWETLKNNARYLTFFSHSPLDASKVCQLLSHIFVVNTWDYHCIV